MFYWSISVNLNYLNYDKKCNLCVTKIAKYNERRSKVKNYIFIFINHRCLLVKTLITKYFCQTIKYSIFPTICRSQFILVHEVNYKMPEHISAISYKAYLQCSARTTKTSKAIVLNLLVHMYFGFRHGSFTWSHWVWSDEWHILKKPYFQEISTRHCQYASLLQTYTCSDQISTKQHDS